MNNTSRRFWVCLGLFLGLAEGLDPVIIKISFSISSLARGTHNRRLLLSLLLLLLLLSLCLLIEEGGVGFLGLKFRVLGTSSSSTTETGSLPPVFVFVFAFNRINNYSTIHMLQCFEACAPRQIHLLLKKVHTRSSTTSLVFVCKVIKLTYKNKIIKYFTCNQSYTNQGQTTIPKNIAN